MSGDASSSSEPASLALPAPTVLVDALPYIDGQYNDPAIKKQVHALIAEEMKTFKPDDYLAKWPMHEPNFESTTLLQAEWMRVCEGAPMSKIDTSRYQLDPPPPSAQRDPEAWRHAVDNAKAQLENQATRCAHTPLPRRVARGALSVARLPPATLSALRSIAPARACASACVRTSRSTERHATRARRCTHRLVNLELLQQHGAKLWVAHCNHLEASATQLDGAEQAVAQQIEELNRKRKAEQLSVAPTMHGMQREWVDLVKKNLEIESETLKLEAECAALKETLEARKRRHATSSA